MILRRALRPQAIARTLEQSPSRTLLQSNRQQHRKLHALPPLGHNDVLAKRFEREGIPGFMTPRAFQQVWKVYTQALVDKMNEATAGTDYQQKTPHQIHLEMSRQPDRAALYNAAAMAHFNHFFFEGLKAEPASKNLDGSEFSVEEQIKAGSRDLLAEIEESFDGSIDNLRDAMLDHANAIFGNGFVWLVRYKTNPMLNKAALKVLCTYNAGSPYSQAYKMRQGIDRTTGSEPVRNPQEFQYSRPRQGVGATSHAKDGMDATNSLQATPLLCINVWQLAYVLDYGLSPMGKETYTKAWWQTIDWAEVNNRYQNAQRIRQ